MPSHSCCGLYCPFEGSATGCSLGNHSRSSRAFPLLAAENAAVGTTRSCNIYHAIHTHMMLFLFDFIGVLLLAQIHETTAKRQGLAAGSKVRDHVQMGRRSPQLAVTQQLELRDVTGLCARPMNERLRSETPCAGIQGVFGMDESGVRVEPRSLCAAQ